MTVLYRAPDGTAFTSAKEINEANDLVGSLAQFSDHGEYERYVESYVARSAQVRAELLGEIGIPYGPSLAETLDIFPGAPGGPLVVFVHGGSWIELTSAEHSFIAPGLVEHGATVVIPTYALAPTVSIDEIVRQVRAAFVWAYRNGSRYGADPSRIVTVGHSAGGHLVARLLETDWEGEYGLPSSPIAGAVALTGIFDLRPIPYTSEQELIRLTADQVLRNSPILNLPLQAPPLLLTYAANQPLEYKRQSNDYFRAWTAMGLTAEVWEREGVNHFDEIDDLGRADSELTRRVLALTQNESALSGSS